MVHRIGWIFLAVAVAFFLFLTGLTGYRVETERERNAAGARESTAALAAKVAALGERPGGTGTAAFVQGMRDLLSNRPRSLLACLRSVEGEVLYLSAAHRSLLIYPDRLGAQWRGTPRYAVRSGVHALTTLPLQIGAGSFLLDEVWVTEAKEDLYPIFRDDLFLCLAFLIVCGIVLLTVSMLPDEKTDPAIPASTPEVKEARDLRVPEVKEAQDLRVPEAKEAKPEPREPPREASATRSAQRDSLYAPASGLVFREHFPQRLRAEIERAAAFDEDMSLCMMRMDDPPSEPLRTELLTGIAEDLRAAFPVRDLIFEGESDSFAVILPDTDIDQALAALETIRAKVEGREIAGMRRTLSAGASSRGGRLLDEQALLEESGTALEKARSEGGNQVVGFRADAMKFREALNVSGSQQSPA